MLSKPRRPREKRIVPLTRVTYSIAEFCEKTSLTRQAVLRSIDEGSLRIVRIGHRQLILARRPSGRTTQESIVGFLPGSSFDVVNRALATEEN